MVLIAESFSGPLAIRFAAANPDRVRALILCASFIRLPKPPLISPAPCANTVSSSDFADCPPPLPHRRRCSAGHVAQSAPVPSKFAAESAPRAPP